MADTLKNAQKGADVKRYAIEKILLGFDAPAPTAATPTNPICNYWQKGVNKGKPKPDNDINCVNERI